MGVRAFKRKPACLSAIWGRRVARKRTSNNSFIFISPPLIFNFGSFLIDGSFRASIIDLAALWRRSFFHIWPPFNMSWEAGRSSIWSGQKTKQKGEWITSQMSNYIPASLYLWLLNECVLMKLGWQRAGATCDDARRVGTSTTTSVCDSKGPLGYAESRARHLINSSTSSSRDTYHSFWLPWETSVLINTSTQHRLSAEACHLNERKRTFFQLPFTALQVIP